jgi:hypothetical protein
MNVLPRSAQPPMNVPLFPEPVHSRRLDDCESLDDVVQELVSDNYERFYRDFGGEG